MKSTRRLIDNLVNDEFRKSNVDLGKAVDHIMKRRIENKKKEFIKSLNDK